MTNASTSAEILAAFPVWKIAKTVGVDESTVRRWRQRGSIPATHVALFVSHREAERKVRRAKTNTERARNTHLRLKYKLTADDVTLILKSQSGLCLVCSQPLNGKWHIDHCHKTGKIRGLLHHGCNLVLGHAHDSISVLRGAISYLQQHGISQ